MTTWLIAGNSNIDSTKFLGTTNPQPLIIKTNNKEAMRVSSTDGDVSIGEQGATRSPDYKLDVQGILNADDIYKGGSQLVGSQWEDVTDDGISYGAGTVSIGEQGASRSPDYKLDVQGILNADDIYKGGSQLVGSQWEDVTDDGISYGAGNVGVGKAPAANYKLDVAGTLNATDYHRNGSALISSQWQDVSGGISYTAGNVGVGKAPAANYKLDVAGTLNATDYHKNGSALISSQWQNVSGGISYTAGNVGVGKASSTSYKLDVAGTLNATDYHKNGSALISSQWQNVSGGISYTAGRVGIGITSTGAGLTVARTSVSNESAFGIDARAFGDGTGPKYGISAVASGGGEKRAGYFQATSPADVNTYTSGGVFYATGEGTGLKDGIWVEASGGGFKRGGYFQATSPAGVNTSTFGGVFYGYGDGTGPKYGISAVASGGGNKWAGYFEATTRAGGDQTVGQDCSASGDGTGLKFGIRAYASGGGEKQAGRFEATSPAGVNAITFGGVFKATGGGGETQAGRFEATNPAGVNTTTFGGIFKASGGGETQAGRFEATSPAGVNTTTFGGIFKATGGGEKQAGRFEATSPAGVNTSTYGGSFYATGEGTGLKIGIYATASGAGNVYAGYFANKVRVQGNFEVGGQKAFVIDHPLDPENKTLRHNSVESPENLCLYRGKVKLGPNGSDTVRMPNYFAALINEDEATAYLTPVGEEPFPTSYKWNEAHTELTIFGREGAEVAYLVLADRDDRTMQLYSRPVEEQKGGSNFERGKLLSPEAFDQPLERGAGPLPRQEETMQSQEEIFRADPVPPGRAPTEPVAPEMPAEVQPEGSHE